MPVFSPPAVEKPWSGKGGGVHPPAYGGGDDGGPGDGAPNFEHRLHRARLALIIGLIWISALFITVTTFFILLRHSSLTLNGRTTVYLREWVTVALPMRLLVINTFVLLLSSFTIERARLAVNREMVLAPVRAIPGIAIEIGRRFPWLAATVALGLTFLSGQWMAWQKLLQHGFSIHSSASSSFVYILTVAHAIHLAGGVIVLLYAGIAAIMQESIERRRIVVEIARWYWHFMGALWVYIFGLIRFAL